MAEKVYSLDITAKKSKINYQCNIEEECSGVPKFFFDYATCLNYIHLAKDPNKVVSNIASFLKKGGTAIIDFHSLIYWYLGSDGLHHYTFHPTQIKEIVSEHFSEFIIIPLGNYLLACANYYSQQFNSKYARKILGDYLIKGMGKIIGKKLGDPVTAIDYLVIAIK